MDSAAGDCGWEGEHCKVDELSALEARVDAAIAVAKKRLREIGRKRTAVDLAECTGIRLVLDALERGAAPPPEARPDGA